MGASGEEKKTADEWFILYGLVRDSMSKQPRNIPMTDKEFWDTLEGLTQFA